jgi:hypothetical protein
MRLIHPLERNGISISQLCRPPRLRRGGWRLGISLAMTVLLAMTAPSAAWSVGFSGGAAGHVGGFGQGNAGGHLGPAGRGGLDGRFDHLGPFDHEGRFDHGGMQGFRNHVQRRFAYPVCFAYAYCPSPALPCIWQGGYWTVQPTFDAAGVEIDVSLWVPPGCY